MNGLMGPIGPPGQPGETGPRGLPGLNGNPVRNVLLFKVAFFIFLNMNLV